jgi:hypothetical protein
MNYSIMQLCNFKSDLILNYVDLMANWTVEFALYSVFHLRLRMALDLSGF